MCARMSRGGINGGVRGGTILIVFTFFVFLETVQRIHAYAVVDAKSCVEKKSKEQDFFGHDSETVLDARNMDIQTSK